VRIRFAQVLAAIAMLSVLASARAEDERLAGSKLVLRKGPLGEHLVVVAHEGVVAPLPGGSEDPTRVGAVLDISNPRTGEHARFETAPRDWTVNALGTIFRFHNHLEKGPGSEVRALVIKHERRLKISTRALGITLDEEAQQALSVVLTTGTRRYCLLFGGKIGKDKPGRFVARNAPAPTACPAPIVVTSTTTTSRPPGTRVTSTSVTSSTNVTASTGATTSTSTSTPPTLPLGTTTSTAQASSSTSTTHVTTPTSTTATVRPTTSTSTSTSSSTTQPPPTTSSTQPPPPTTSSTVVTASTTTTTSTERVCSAHGNSCKGTCPLGLQCRVVGDLCACFP